MPRDSEAIHGQWPIKSPVAFLSTYFYTNSEPLISEVELL